MFDHGIRTTEMRKELQATLDKLSPTRFEEGSPVGVRGENGH